MKADFLRLVRNKFEYWFNRHIHLSFFMSHHILDGFHVLTDFFCRSDSKNNDEISINLYEEKKKLNRKRILKEKMKNIH